MEIEWNAETVSKLLGKHYDELSLSDKATVQQICILAVRKALSRSVNSPTHEG